MPTRKLVAQGSFILIIIPSFTLLLLHTHAPCRILTRHERLDPQPSTRPRIGSLAHPHHLLHLHPQQGSSPLVGTARVTPDEKREFLALIAEGWTLEQAALRIGRSHSWAKTFMREVRAQDPNAGRSPASPSKQRPVGTLIDEVEPAKPSVAADYLLRPFQPSELSPIAADCLEDFGRFRYRYFGRLSSPWQEDAANMTRTKLASPFKEYGVVNAPPGSGKSTLFTHDIPAWLTCRSRSLRGFIGSSTQTMANSYVGRLRNTLDRKIPMQASSEDIAHGLGRDADATLIQEYGRFKPDPTLGAPWTQKQFTVAQFVDTPIGEKESTWTAFGEDTKFLGWRVNIAIWDDLVTQEVLKNLDRIEAQRKWWIDEAQTRIEPGGLLLLQGQRLGAEDLYRFCLDMKSGYTELDEHLFELGEEELPTENKYFHIKYKAHYEEHCQAEEHPEMHRMKAPAYLPEDPDSGGCLLEPARLPWRELKSIMEQPLTNFEVVYQQGDTTPDEVLVPQHWLDGGLYQDGIDYPGCFDRDRTLGVVPAGLTGIRLSVITVDPSPTKYWAIQWWVYIQPPGTAKGMGFRYLIDQIRMPLGANDLLDFIVSLNDYVGILDEWVKRARNLNCPITHLIVEKNAAQRFLMQYDWFRRWLSLRSVTLRPHETENNKSDPKYGVMTIRSHYRYGRVRLPGARDAQVTPTGGVAPLTRELTRYPQSSTDDCIMAHWFLEYNLQFLVRETVGLPSLYNDMPSWVKPTQPVALFDRKAANQ